MFPINQYRENKLIRIGNNTGKFLGLVKTVKIDPSPTAIKKASSEADKSYKRGVYSANLDKFWKQRYYIFEKFD